MTDNMTAGVAVILKNQKNEYLLHLRDSQTTNMPDQWCLVGGAVNADESIVRAVFREVKEETGLTVSQIQFFKKILHNKESEISIYTGHVDTEKEQLILGEGKRLTFFTKEKAFALLNDLKYTNPYLETLKEYLAIH